MADRYDVGAPSGGSSTAAAEVPRIESPSLFAAGRGGPTAYEVKFLLSEDQARAVEARIAGPLSLDPHADAAFGNGYLTTSVYTDTPTFDVLMRAPGKGARKYRVRRYGLAGPLFAERKTKRGQEVRKRRSPVPDGLVAPFMEVAPCEGWACEWFRRQTAARNLQPVCRVSYDRVAYMGKAADGDAVRVTFDRNVRGALADGWDAVPVVGPALLPGQVICEFKFRVTMPVMFKAVVEDMALAPATVSKYRLFMSAARVQTGGSKVDV